MFTGLVQDIGKITAMNKNDKDVSFEIQVTNLDLSNTQIGDSIMCSGCCLTATSLTNNKFTVDVSAESLDKTTLRNWIIGSHVNLEPALRASDHLGGHIVSGHVDTTTKIISITPDGQSKRTAFQMPKGYRKFIAPKGSITIDGISLTVNNVNDDQFDVNIIPHTMEMTTLKFAENGSEVNIEIDILARYVANMLEHKDT